MSNKSQETQHIADKVISDKDWLDLSWNYFSLLSGQRMGMIEFYIVIEVALGGALFTLASLATRILWAEITVAFAISFISLIFFLLDQRTRDMIHCCENAITHIEGLYGADDPRMPFHTIQKMTEKESAGDNGKSNENKPAGDNGKSKKRKLTYTRIFRLQFMIVGLFGLGYLFLLLNGMI